MLQRRRASEARSRKLAGEASIKFDILFHGFLLFLDRFDHGGHFLVNGIDLPVGFIAESKK